MHLPIPDTTSHCLQECKKAAAIWTVTAQFMDCLWKKRTMFRTWGGVAWLAENGNSCSMKAMEHMREKGIQEVEEYCAPPPSKKKKMHGKSKEVACGCMEHLES